MTSRPASPRRYRSHLLALEPRMMFDAAAAVAAQGMMAENGTGDHGVPAPFDSHDAAAANAEPAHAEPVATTPASDAADPYRPVTVESQAQGGRETDARYTDSREAAPTDTHDAAMPAVVAAEPAPAAAREIVFIDTSVADYRQLADEWAERGSVVLIDGTKDGIDQVRAALAGQSDIAAIHIVSHGSEGAFWLGTTKVDTASITGDLASSLGAIGRSLASGGDIMIYGCDFAEGDAGATALAAFADATHADVAASTDVTGFASRGGDWVLEAHRGTIEAHELSSADWVHTLDPNQPVPISVAVNSLTVKDGSGATVFSTANNYNNNATRSPDVGVGAVATWANAATYQGHSVDLKATIVSLSTGDAVQFNRVTGTGTGPDDPTFLLRDLTGTGANNTTPAVVEIRWELVDHTTGEALPADVRFTIADIDGIDGNRNSRETVSTSTDNLAYYTANATTDIRFNSTLDRIEATGTRDENNPVGATLTPQSAASFDWTRVSSFTLTYTLAPNAVTTQAQFYHDGDADFVYDSPVYVSIPRLDLDGDNSTATGDDAHFTFTENGPGVPVVDSDIVVSNPMDINSITGATVTLTNYQAGDTFSVGTLPGGIAATVGPVTNGTVTVTLSGASSEADYETALQAIRFGNTSEAPSATQRVIEIAFTNGTLTSASAISRIDVIPVNDAPDRVGTLAAQTTTDAATVSYATRSAFTDVDGDTLTYSASGLPAGLTIDAATGVISGTVGRSASQSGGGSYAVVVTARDASNATTTQGFTITVANPAPTAVNDTATTREDTAVTIAVLGNDTDPDGDPLSVTAASALHGTVVRNADGTLTYTPDADYTGSDTLSYSIADGQGGTSSATVAITITPVNDAPRPVTVPLSYATTDGARVDASVAPAFSDPDGDRLTYAATGLPAGLSIDPATGMITGVVDRSASQVNGGRYTVTITATDPSNTSATQTGTLIVTNPAPTARNDSATTTEDTPVTITVLANDSDPDGDPLTVTAASALHGSIVRNADGTLTYTPDADYTGTDTIRYTIADGQGGTSSATVAVTVTPVNDAPVSVGTLPARSTQDAANVSYATAGGFADIDGDTLTYAASGLPAGLSIDAATGVISGTIDRAASQANGGSYAVVVTARDPSSTSTTQRFTITVANPAPVATDDGATTAEDTPVTIPVLANDRDPDGDPLSVTAASALHGSVIRNANGTLTYTPNGNYNGSDTIRYTIADGQGGTSSATVAVTITPVNDAPSRVGTLPARSDADAARVAFATSGSFADVDGDTLTYAASGLPAGLSIDAATGIVSGTIDRSASQTNGGRYAVVITASDPSGASRTQSFAYTVTNPAPVAVNDAATTTEDTSVTIAVLGNDSDPDGDPLAVTAASALHGTVVRNADGTLTYTPGADYNGQDTLSYTIADGQGGASSAIVAITITPVDDAPRAVPVPLSYATTDGASVEMSIAPAFVDPDGDALTYTATGLPSGLAVDPATGMITGVVDRSASQIDGGRYTVTITATDPFGASATQTGMLVVTNPAPVARNDAATTPEDTPVTIPVLANDSDPDGDPLSVIAASALHGSVVRNADGTLTYTPDADYNGADVVTYRTADGEGGTATATVAITVTPVNDAPGVQGTLPDRSTLDGASVFYPTAPGFADVDGDALTYSASGLPAGLTIDPATGVISGTLDRSASQSNGGRYAVVVSAIDGGRLSAVQRFEIAVANPVPIAVDDIATTRVDTPVVIAVLANDGDTDGDTLRVTGAIAGHGSVAVLDDGTLRYTPATGFVGRDTIRYTISDGQGGTAVATVTIGITNDAPVASPVGGIAATDGQTVSLPVGASFSDPDGDPLTFTATGLPPGLAIDRMTGTITGRIDAAASGANGGVYDSVVTASDGKGGVNSIPLHWTLSNPSPTAAADTATTAEDTAVTIPVLANDRDPDGDPLTIVAAIAGHGTVAINADGTLTYTPDADFNGSDTILYTIADGQGARSSASVAVTVTPVDDAPTATPIAPRMTADGASVSVPVASAFTDVEGDRLVYSAIGLPAGLTIDPATGVISGTIASGSTYGGPAGDGVYRAVVTATDPAGRSVDAAFDWTVSQTAPIAADDRATTAEDTAVTIPVLANDRDPDGDPLTIVDAVSDSGTVAIVGGALVFTPARDVTGMVTISYTVADPSGNRATATVTVDVTPVNDAPVATRPLPAIDGRDGQPVVLDVGGFFADPDGDPLRFGASGLPAGLVIDPVTGRISGTLDRAASQAGMYAVIVTATDPSGASVDSRFDWAIVNPSPVATDDAAIVAEDTATVIAVLGNDIDPDGDALRVVDASAAHGRVTINADGTLGYVPDRDFNGSDVIVYTVADGNGGRSTASVLVTVTPVDDAPVAVLPAPPAQTGADGMPVAVDAGALFRDPDGDRLVYTASGLPAGLSIDPASGAIRGTLDRGASQVAGGVYTITVTATDPSGAATSVALRFTATNPAPVAADDAARTARDTGIVIPVLANDRDPDGDPLSVVAAIAGNGTATINADETLTYVPGPNFAGTDTIRYTISDGQGGTATAVVTVTVDPVNRAPVIAGADPVDATGGVPTTIDVLAGITDPDRDALTITAATSANGVVTINRDGTLVFTPALGFAGATTITYTVSDGRGGLASGTIVVRVADGRGADIQELLRIGQVSFRDPPRSLATIVLPADGEIRNPLSLLGAAEGIRSLRTTTIGAHPVGDAVEAIRSLRGTDIDPDHPIAAEVARLDAIRDQRDAGDRLFDHRWGDFLVKGLTGFSAAADRNACVMVESVVRGGAIYLEVRDIAAEGQRAPIRSVDVRLAHGGKPPEWLKVDHRGLAIIERGADMDELHLIVRVTRTDGRTSATPIVVQGATGEVELDRQTTRHTTAAPLDATLHSPRTAAARHAARLASHFE